MRGDWAARNQRVWLVKVVTLGGTSKTLADRLTRREARSIAKRALELADYVGAIVRREIR